MIYDVVVIGGGIAGLYTTYQILRKSPTMRVLVLEKRRDLGGRVYTSYDFPGTPVEGGAGRFSDQHKRLWALLRELRLDTHAVELPANGQYIDSDSGRVASDYHADVAEVVAAARHVSREVLQAVSFLDYARKVVGRKRAQHIVDSFGYYSELVVMNAHDAMVLMGVLDTYQTRFYSLAGGLSQIIERLAAKISTKARILKGHTVVAVGKRNHPTQKRVGGRRVEGHTRRRRPVVSPPYWVETETGNGAVRRFWARRCVFAVPKQALERLELMRPVWPLLRHIRCGSLCRIYAKFSPSKWLVSLVKTTTNNDLRMVIPIDPKAGIVMASYTDNRFADRWRRMEQTKGVDAVRARLVRLLKQTFPDAANDLAIQDVRVFYWPCGVGYWGVGADSADIARRLVEPLPGIYVCGEHFSETNQQWMEGALETSEEVVRRCCR